MKLKWGHIARNAGLALLMVTSAKSAESQGTAGLTLTNGTKHIQLPVVSGVDGYKVLTTTNLSQPFHDATPGAISGYNWTQPGQGIFEFFRVEMQPKPPESLRNATLLNRIAYGATPDELDRLTQIGPDAYIREQLAPETIGEDLEIDRVMNSTDWQYVTVTGSASSSTLYLILTSPGDCYIDDIKIVPGTVAEQGVNAVINGDFESGFSGWTNGAPYAESTISTAVKRSGSASLFLKGRNVDDARVESSGTAMRRADLALRTTAGQNTYTLSYWFKAGPSATTPPLLIRLSGADPGSNEIYSVPGTVATKLAEGTAGLADLAAWHSLHAVQSKKQLLEVMLQFLENHFVTQQRKSREYFDRFYENSETDIHATNLEFRELERWRQALLKPGVTFHELLKISAESPAMIIYLDTVGSRGDGSNIANENYARELLELFTFGVDNGYDQNDITVLSRAWTGWTVRLVDPTNIFNPFAPQSRTLRPGGTNETQIDNLEGKWGFVYRPERHSAGPKVLFPGKTVPARFGAPYAGRNYELRLGTGSSTNWEYITFTGRPTRDNPPLYLYNTGAGDCYIDDIKIVAGNVAEAGPNLLPNGDFENGLNGWTVSANMSGSTTTGGLTHSGAGALHMVDTSAEGTSQGQSIWRGNLNLRTNQTYTISYWYRPGTNMNGNLVIRLSGDGIISSPGTSTNSIQEGYQVLEHFADQPFTQEFMSVKLCRLLVHDDFYVGYDFTDPNLSPEGRLVRDCMAAWEQNMPKGQIRKVLEVILNSELFRTQSAAGQKVKTPFEFVVSAIRALRAQATDGTYTANSDGYGISGRTSSSGPLNRMGRMRLFDREEPDGYPEAGAPWISAGTLTERLRFVQSFLLPTPGNDATGNRSDPVKLLKSKLPAGSWNDPYAVADFFTRIIYPGEGRANLDEYRQMAGWYLNTGDNGGAGTPFAELNNTTSAYDLRVRGMVAMLLTYPRFQEQ